MNKRNDSERCMSTASSTVSGIYSNFLPVSQAHFVTNFNSVIINLFPGFKSPDPVCMFYFAHPFGGIATPASTSYSIDPYAGMPTAEKTSHNVKHENPASNRCCTQQHLNDFTPWPRQTWQSKDLLSPLIQALQKQIGKLYTDYIYKIWL